MNNLDLDNTIDEDFFGTLKGSTPSKLQQLFVEDALFPDDKQQSLKYQRPKDLPTSSNATNSTLMAKVVTAYKQGEFQGKVGLALIQNSDNTCNIIVYKTKNLILTTLKLLAGKDLLYKQTKYWQFYDEGSTYWSFSFDSQFDEEEFLEKLHIKNITFKESREVDQDAQTPSDLLNLNSETQSKAFEKFTSKTLAGAKKETKNSLIQRMAKMGKPLPTLSSSPQQTTTEFSDSSDTEVIKTPLALAQKPFIAPRSNKLSSNNANQHLVPSVVTFNSVGTTSGAVYPINPVESQYMQMLLSEQRTQGSELRMNMNKLENKIEKVLDKLELYDNNDGKQKTEKEDEILELEEKLIKLKKENRKLKQNLQEIKDSEESGIKVLLYDLKDDLKLFNIDYTQDFKNILIEINYKLKESHLKIQVMQKKRDENELKLKEIETDLELETSRNIELHNEVSSLRLQVNELRLQLDKKEIDNAKHLQEILNLKKELQEKTQETLKSPNVAVVKSIMNNLYVDIVDKLNVINLPQSEQILSLIASSIKQQTLQSLQQNKPRENN